MAVWAFCFAKYPRPARVVHQDPQNFHADMSSTRRELSARRNRQQSQDIPTYRNHFFANEFSSLLARNTSPKAGNPKHKPTANIPRPPRRPHNPAMRSIRFLPRRSRSRPRSKNFPLKDSRLEKQTNPSVLKMARRIFSSLFDPNPESSPARSHPKLQASIASTTKRTVSPGENKKG